MFAWAAATAYAATDEWHQAFVPGRGPALTDVGIDSLGAATALLAAWLRRRLQPY
ncbi:VanZ like family protein [compost metagenome]